MILFPRKSLILSMSTHMTTLLTYSPRIPHYFTWIPLISTLIAKQYLNIAHGAIHMESIWNDVEPIWNVMESMVESCGFHGRICGIHGRIYGIHGVLYGTEPFHLERWGRVNYCLLKLRPLTNLGKYLHIKCAVELQVDLITCAIFI